jgi:ribulose-phosphate 3-epimerase
MPEPIRIDASGACANFAALDSDLKQLSAVGVDYLHIDIMDGRFVDNFCLDFSLMETNRRICDIPMDRPLMIGEPERYVGRAVAAGARWLAIHFEATRHAQRARQQIREDGVRPGIALNPAAPPGSLNCILDDIDMVTVTTVNPGAVGQRPIPATMKRMQKFTPSLPDVNPAQVSKATERIRLEPHGSAKLRLTILPEVKAQAFADLPP